MPESESNIIIYNTIDGKASVALYAKDDKDLAQSKTDGGTFCHLDCQYQYAYI